ncbi:hypothetical protein DFJ74DRAFT_666722 [Hyaloraphidium curvatum]|nr:hypothetical protein DFJ74DRAFT_666722 [Hyaloraphidium curvatum]
MRPSSRGLQQTDQHPCSADHTGADFPTIGRLQPNCGPAHVILRLASNVESHRDADRPQQSPNAEPDGERCHQHRPHHRVVHVHPRQLDPGLANAAEREQRVRGFRGPGRAASAHDDRPELGLGPEVEPGDGLDLVVPRRCDSHVHAKDAENVEHDQEYAGTQ